MYKRQTSHIPSSLISNIPISLVEPNLFFTPLKILYEKYQMICVNKPIMKCEYQEKGYTKNISKQFKENPNGYYKYFQRCV